MTAPEDNGAVLSAVDDIRRFEFVRGADSRAEEVATLTAERDDWHKRYDDYVASHPDTPTDPPPDPEPTVQLFGTSYGGADESKNHGRAEVARIFFTGAPPANPFADGDYRQAYADGVRHFVFSWHGGTPANVKDAFASIPDGITVYGCLHHEPEDNIAKGSYTLAEYQRDHKAHADAMREVGVVPVTILQQYTLARGSGRDVTDYYLGDDGFMFDYYMNPAKGKDDPENAVDKMVEAGMASGAKWVGIGETGCPSSVAEPTVYDLVKRLRAKLAATPEIRLACYWPARDFAFPSERVADAWFEG